jgi:RNA polymerase sigma factor (sigma-70 family)
MLPRRDIVPLFSTFLQFDSDRFGGWATDPRLRRNMLRRLEQVEQAESSEYFWALYWHKFWLAQPESLAATHLTAYLQEVCYWAARKTSTRFASPQYGLADCFQAAIARVDKVFRGFNATQGTSLKNYASITFSNAIREFLRQRQEVDICSDWALLRKISQKRLAEALQSEAIPRDTLDRYLLAWNCFKTLCVPSEARSTRKLAKPDGDTWQAIAQLYNSERLTQLQLAGPESSPANLEMWLLASARAARAYLYPTLTSLNAPKPGRDSGDLGDDLVGEGEGSLLGEAIAAEDRQVRLDQRQQLNGVLANALGQLDAEIQTILQMYYEQQLTQQDIAAQLGTKQYTVSRRFSKARQSLLTELAQWSSKTLHIPLSSELLNQMSAVLDEWLASHYQPSDLPS